MGGVSSSIALAASPCPQPPPGSDARRELARKIWKAGNVHHERGELSEAIDAWRCAHQLKPHPLALYNIARAAERLGRWPVALEAYLAYLRQQADTPERAVILATVARLRARIRAERPRFRRRPRPVKSLPPERRPAIELPRNAPLPQSRRSALITGWTLVGFAGAAFTLSAVCFGMAQSDRIAIETAWPGTSWKDELLPHDRRYSLRSATGWAMVGLASASVITGVVLLVVARRGRRTERRALDALLPGGLPGLVSVVEF
jgi:tetratricopeptide (TPR) repeat protein